MNKYRHLLMGGFLIALMVTSAAALPAAAQDNLGMARGRTRLARLFGVHDLVGRLNLTPDQKTQIKTILQNNRPQILQTTRGVVKARLDLLKGLPDAATELANAQLQAANLKRQIFEQIKPVLAPDQLAKVQERQQQREQRLQKLLDRLNNKIGG